MQYQAFNFSFFLDLLLFNLNTCIKFHLIVGDDSLKYMRNTLHFNHMVEINYILKNKLYFHKRHTLNVRI